jgi:hypothetical protein
MEGSIDGDRPVSDFKGATLKTRSCSGRYGVIAAAALVSWPLSPKPKAGDVSGRMSARLRHTMARCRRTGMTGGEAWLSMRARWELP